MLIQWIIAYPMNTGSMTESEWNSVYDKFCSDLRKFRLENNVQLILTTLYPNIVIPGQRVELSELNLTNPT